MVKYARGKRTRQQHWRFVAGGVAMGVFFAVGLGLSVHLLFAKDSNIRTAEADTTPRPGKAVNGVQTIANPPKKDPMHTGLELSVDPSIRKLAEYEKAYGGAVATHLMVFAGLPATNADADADALDMATKLQEFARFNIHPLVVMEPTINGTSINVSDFAAGKYDASLTRYFKNLKAHGVTDAMMGTWVHFPEDNIPEWGNTDAGMFKTNVVKAARLQKGVFPGSKVSILLNAQTFRSDDTERNYGKFVSLLPYVRGLPSGLFSSFGLQGFPWVSQADQKEQNKLLNPAQYLNANFAREAAKALGVKNIWFNTGTFNKMYTNTASQTVTYTPTQRQNILQQVMSQVKVAQRGGYHVSVNLFSFDGSSTGEATDWSYWHTGDTDVNAPGKVVFRTFAEQLYQAKADVWVFDSD
ncbi:MAG TPA: hypothetical protein VLF62_06345 [Candidatus Saccharimonadales bacterium]|nr:hypothetical protein [Candidatus Saccharimonadales bacterium]